MASARAIACQCASSGGARADVAARAGDCSEVWCGVTARGSSMFERFTSRARRAILMFDPPCFWLVERKGSWASS